MESEQSGFPAIVSLSEVADERGRLVIGDAGTQLPFAAQRFFFISSVPAGAVRGAHAHRECEQFLVCVNGSVTAIVDNGRRKGSVVLDSAARGLYMPAMTWGTQTDYSDDAVLLVLASLPYDEADYIHDYDDFMRLAQT